MNETVTERQPSAVGTLARRALAWVVLVAVAVILLKVAVGIVLSFVHAIIIIALLAVLGVGVLWALRHLQSPVPYLIICFFFGLAGGIVGRIKGSSFLLWFLISALIPFGGLLAAILYRYDRDEPRRECPRCGKVLKLHDQVCMRCGLDLDYPVDWAAPQRPLERREAPQ